MFLLCKDIYGASQCAVLHHSWAYLRAACLGGDSSFLPHPTQPSDTPHHFPHSRQPCHGNCLSRRPNQQKICSTFYFLFAFCLPAWGNTQEDQIQEKNKTIIPFPWQLDQSSCTSKAQSDTSKSLRRGENKQEHYLICLDTLTSLIPKHHPNSSLLSHSKVSGGPLLLCQETFCSNARIWKLPVSCAHSLT